jgi:Flp pilus assembly protein TadB
MTANQVAALEYQRKSIADSETARANRAKEAETNRANVAKERETERSNRAKESETKRHNQYQESVDTANAVTSGVGNLGKGIGALLPF